ncbi:MAG: hypothetical protein L6R40_004525 [Gallowayella cf. fulva]|nr:MAG: hypothetical protein L6R40_004525 [Xanthomendoza cf. fulva]
MQSTCLKRGDYAPVRPGDLRSPCPAINALANHGYLPRDGRNVRASELLNGMNQYGLGTVFAFFLTHPIFLEQKRKDAAVKCSWWNIMVHPFAYAFAAFGLRNPGQINSGGVACLNLNQLASHNVIEHDVSLTRLDAAQGDNNTPQPELIDNLLTSSSNGKTITLDDFVKLRRQRYEKQKADNPDLDFHGMRVQIACAEVAMILKVFGDGEEVSIDYVKAFFRDGRLPRDEGWSKRKWWTLGLVELNTLSSKIMGLLGPPGEGAVPIANAIH